VFRFYQGLHNTVLSSIQKVLSHFLEDAGPLKFAVTRAHNLRSCCGLTLLGSSAPRSHSLTPPQPRDGAGNRKGESEKTHGGDKDSSAGKAKATCASQAKQGIHSLLRVGSHLRQSRAPSRVSVTREDKRHRPKCPPFLPLRPALHAEHNVTGCGVSLG